MVLKRKTKYKSGEGSLYITRKQAVKKLQLTLKDFRRLCILKGVYPREPQDRRKAQRGKPGIKTLYALKDIRFLMHEPIIWTFREFKIFAKRIAKARGMRDHEALKRHVKNYPRLRLDTIVKERYPSFVHALRDLDDCLNLVFLFSTFPSLKHVKHELSALCRRLSVEFLHIVIAAKALRKVFISIKGYYFQVELKGETITWIMPHQFPFVPQETYEVDFKLMSVFVEFYITLLGFVNFRLYHSLNLHYPPTFQDSLSDPSEKMLVDEAAFVSERVAALNIPIQQTGPSPLLDEDVEIDQFHSNDTPIEVEEAQHEANKIKNLKKLFEGLKFFINREVPREPLVFMIRCFGGEVSWDKLLFVGATFDESDESITHQIVDRPQMDKQYLSRNYIQPQWVFDSVNARQLLPVAKYFIGAVLPPHLSPFVDKTRQRYVPPEEKEMENSSLAETILEGADNEEEEDQEYEKPKEKKRKEKRKKIENIPTENKDDVPTEKKKVSSMSVEVGTVAREDPKEKVLEQTQENQLRETMIVKKYRKLYRSMMQGRRKREKQIQQLIEKRRKIDKEENMNRKKAKKVFAETSISSE